MLKRKAYLFFWGLGLLVRSNPVLSGSLALTALASGAIPAISLYATKLVLDALVGVLEAGQRSASMTAFLNAVFFQFVLLLIGSAIEYLSGLLRSTMNIRFTTSLQVTILDKVASLDADRFERADFYDVISRAHGQSMQSPLNIVNMTFNFVKQAVSILSASIVLASVSVALLVIAWLISIPTFVLSRRLGEKRFSLEQERTMRHRFLSYLSSNIVDPIMQAEIRLFDLRNFLMDRWKKLRSISDDENIRLARYSGRNVLLNDCISLAGTAGTTMYLTLAALRGAGSTVGTIMMGVGSFRMTAASIGQLLSTLAQIFEQLLFIGNLEKLLKMESRMLEGSRALRPGDLWEELAFRDVSFSYPSKAVAVLKNVNLTIRRGRRTAIVGVSGAGKSTILKLLMRLYDPTCGSVLIDGNPISEYKLSDYRSLFSIRFERFGRYAMSARENITLGDTPATDEDGRYDRAVAIAGLRSLLLECDNGEACLSRQFDNGRDISEGQWSRFALARSLFRKADILVLDEPTAFLDPESEEKVIEDISRLAPEVTIIVISHRPGVIAMADDVIFLEQGEIAASGSAEIVARQCEGYRRWYHEGNT